MRVSALAWHGDVSRDHISPTTIRLLPKKRMTETVHTANGADGHSLVTTQRTARCNVASSEIFLACAPESACARRLGLLWRICPDRRVSGLRRLDHLLRSRCCCSNGTAQDYSSCAGVSSCHRRCRRDGLPESDQATSYTTPVPVVTAHVRAVRDWENCHLKLHEPGPTSNTLPRHTPVTIALRERLNTQRILDR
jgi:hypothetical protein